MNFAYRLAARKGTKARTLCRDFDLRFQGVVDGDPETLEALADLAGVGGNALQSGALVKTGAAILSNCEAAFEAADE